MAFKLPDLPYAHDALEPVIDKQTMEIHHGKHHQGYVNNLTNAVEGKGDLERKSLEALIGDIKSLPGDIQTAVRNNGGGHWNHSQFWTYLAPKGKGGKPSAELQKAIDAFGGLDKLKETFNKAAGGRFGSGWAWVIVNDQGALEVTSTPNQDNPLMKGIVDKTGTPILGLDVWEHAYYLKYQNKRPDYVQAFWDIVNWETVSKAFADATK